MPRASVQNQEALGTLGSFTGQFVSALQPKLAYDSIIDFACHPSFCGKKLYPRQRTLLKLIYLETENMTTYDVDVIEEWRNNFSTKGKTSYGVQPDIWKRIAHLKSRGYRHFPHIESIMGRRASKGMIGGILGAEKLSHLISLDSWQDHYGIQSGKDGYLSVIATNMLQSKKFLFADIRDTVTNCKSLQKHISASNEYKLHLRTPADLRRIAEMNARHVPIEHEIASLRCLAMASTSSSGRGGVGFCLDLDTPVLTADLRWVPIQDVEIGEELVGVDEIPEKGKQRKVRVTKVTGKKSSYQKSYRLSFSDSTSVVCSGDHQWLIRARGAGSNCIWRKTRGKSDFHSIKIGTEIVQLVEPWQEDSSWEAGYLAGFYDGEGHVPTSDTKCGISVYVSQNPGPVLDNVLKLMKEKGFTPLPQNIYSYKENSALCQQWAIRGMAESLRFLGQIKPARLAAKARLAYNGVSLRGKGSTRGEQPINYKTVISIEELPEQELVDIETDSHTFIASGLVSHNCNMYDEFAHLITTTEGPRSSQEIYEAYQPALDEFGQDSLTYIPSSPYTKIGYFYNLYVYGSVLMQEYLEETGVPIPVIENQGQDPEEKFEELTADPEMLIVQLPSWELYRDWDRSEEICGIKFKRAIQVYDERMKRIEKRNPTKFKVERRAQFAEVQDAYLDPDKVDQMFDPFWDDRVLEQTGTGTLAYIYEGHSDPGRSNANFAVCIAHLEPSPFADEYGQVWSHVIVDHLHVWKPEDYDDHIVNYVDVERDLEILIGRYPALKTFSFDAWNSGGFISILKEKFRRKPRIVVEPFNEKRNQQRAEYFKSSLNLGWVHAYRDRFFGDGQSLLETELKFLTEVHGKVEKQTIGPCTTKDLADCVMVVTHRLLHQQLDQWQRELLGKMPMSKGLPAGRLVDPSAPSVLTSRQIARYERGSARTRLSDMRDGRSRARRAGIGRQR